MCQSTRYHSRRTFLSQAVGASLVGSSILEQAFFRAARARAQASTVQQPVLFDIKKLADGAYAALARPQALINANAAIFEMADELLIVDAHSKPSAAAALAAQIKKEVTDKPIRYIVNTHFHWDHTQGDPAYRNLAPHAQFVASTQTRDLLAQFGVIRAQQSVDQATASLDRYHHQLESAKTSQDKARLQQTITEVNAYLAEMRGYTPILPDITFERSLVMHDKARELHLAFRGRAHTAGDVVVFCLQNKVLATGDLLHGWFPNIGDGYPREWPRTLSALSEFDFDYVVGGHGGVQQGRSRLRQMSAYISEITEAVEAGKRKGETSEQLQAAILPATLRSLDTNYREFLISQSSEPSLSPADYVSDSVKGNVADVYRRLG